MAKNILETPTSPPSSLTMRLNAPGMTPIHRAGLGGLAATLRVLDKIKNFATSTQADFREKTPFNDERWNDDFSWKVEPDGIGLNWGKPENAKRFFDWLCDFAFQIVDDMIFLPGQYDTEENGELKPVSREMRALCQQGILLTILQHGKTQNRKFGESQLARYGEDNANSYRYKPCEIYPHREIWREWIDKNGCLSGQKYKVKSWLYPGAIVRHEAYKSTTVSQKIEEVVSLVFALVGTIALPIDNMVGALIIPYVDNLVAFAKLRGKINFVERPVNLSDAALQFEIKCGAATLALDDLETSGCDVVRFQQFDWAKQLKSRGDALSVDELDHDVRTAYGDALLRFPGRKKKIKVKPKKKSGEDSNAKVEVAEETVTFNSVVRRLIADNMVKGQLWCAGFARFAASIDPATKKPLYEQIKYERTGIYKMITEYKTNNDDETAIKWKPEGSRELVFAVQDALYVLYGRASNAEDVSQAAKEKRLEKEYDEWQRAFSNAKTQAQFRFSLANMFSRAKTVPTLRENENLQTIMTLVETDWELARDLALVALAGYKGKEKSDNVAVST